MSKISVCTWPVRKAILTREWRRQPFVVEAAFVPRSRALSNREDNFAESIINRIHEIPDLTAVKARYHKDCGSRLSLAEKSKSKKSTNIDTAMECIYTFLRDNSDECQFTISELSNQIQGDYKPDSRTIIWRLKQKYENDIMIIEMNRRESIVCFKNTGHKLLAEDWYRNKHPNMEDEKLRVIREAAAIIVADVRSEVFDTKIYPPADNLMENVDRVVPETLRVLICEMISKNKKCDSKILQRKCTSIAHSIISAIRPRSFVSSVLLGIGAFLYKKFASRSLIDIISSLGFCASYTEICGFEAACIRRSPRELMPSAFSQFVFDNADFNTDTLDGYGTFHVMGGIHCVTPCNAVHADTIMAHDLSEKTHASTGDSGVIPIHTYETAKSQGLQMLKVTDVTFACDNTEDIIPTPTDMIWLYGKWAHIDNVPGWNGFMEKITDNCPYKRSRIICLPFINGIPSNYNTIYTSLLEAVRLGRSSGQETIFVTFDQPLYWKARDIVACDNASEFSNVVVRLGGFHLLMSFLGAIGTIMAGSGLDAAFKTVYAENSVQKMFDGHAYSRAVRAHMLAHLCLAKIIMDAAEFTDVDRYEIDSLLSHIDPSAILDAVNDEYVRRVSAEFQKQQILMELKSPTAKLWIQYFRMVTLLKQFIEAERSGNWILHINTIHKMLPIFCASGHFLYAKSAHLYVQDMSCLEERMSAQEFHKFTACGYFTIRRSDKFWCGIMSDMTIEQTLMRSMKVKGGLTQGGRMNDASQRKWTTGATYMQDVCRQVEEFAGIISGTSEQHIDARKTRVSRDNSDAERLYMWFSAHNPFPETVHLMSISTGIVGSEIINCHRAFEIGMEITKKMHGSTYESLSFKRKDKILSLAVMNSSLRIHSVPTAVNPLLLFQRISLSKRSDADLQKFLSYELSPFPLSLFNEEGLRKGTKSSFYKSFTPLPDTPELGTKRLDVIDGGSLLHRVVWDNHCNFAATCKKYVTYVRRHFVNDIIVVFDGYAEDLQFAGTKESERLRRSRKHLSSDIIFDKSTISTVSQEKFLSNERNKVRFINMLTEYLQLADVTVEQAFEDADTLIVQTAIKNAPSYDSVTINGEDIDLLVILTGLGQKTPNVFFRKPGKGKTPEALYCPKSFKHHSVIDHILLLHAFTGCDTTSAIYNIGETKIINVIEANDGLREILHMFHNKKIDIDVLAAAGEKIFFKLFHGTGEVSLNQLRHKQFVKSVSKTKFNLSSLPPTAAAARQHTFRVYHQVQTWLDIYQDPEEWGWRRTALGLEPIMTTQDMAPPAILQSISCKCKSRCGAACSCRKAGLKCSVICAHCSGETCTNVKQLQNILEREDECDYSDSFFIDATNDYPEGDENITSESPTTDDEINLPGPSQKKRKIN